MKVLFSNPPWFDFSDPKRHRKGIRAGSRWPHTVPLSSHPGEFRHGGYLPYPFFMGYAATYAAAKCSNETILSRDSVARNETYNQFFAFLSQEKPDLIFIECATPSWDHDRELIGKIHGLLPGCSLVVAGTISSVRASEILTIKGVVSAIKGEYEKNAVKVIQGATGIIEHDLLTQEEMNASPFPYYENSTARNYWDANPAGIVYPHAQVWASRGCFHKCSFCQWPATMTGNDPDGLHKRTVRFYSPEYMEAFLTELIGKYGFRSIYFDDDTFNLNDRHTLAMCEVMKRVRLPWSAMCRADTSSKEVWREMKASGCYGVKIGFESGSQRVLDRIIGKKLDLPEAEAAGRYLTEIGINWHGTFTIGLPGETQEEAKMTHDLIARCREHGMKTWQLSGTAVQDGTPLDTLRNGQPMPAYPDARLDANYIEATDGAKKAEAL